MKRGGKIFCGVAVMAIAGCSDSKLEVRSIPPPLSAAAKPVPLRIAEARGQLRLGNVALALESFRKAVREDPSSIDALAGIAACYDRMGRFDLSRRHYEAALAVAPGDVDLLEAFAASLAAQGMPGEAASVRREVAARLAAAASAPAPAVPAEPESRAQKSAAEAPVASLDRHHAQAPPTPVEAARPVAPAPLQTDAVAPARETAVAPAPVIGRSATVTLPPPRPATPAPRASGAAVALTPQIGRSVTVTLPPPRPALRAPEPEARRVAAISHPPATPAQQPRLERLSMGEVALVTTAGPQWLRVPPARSQSATPAVRLLNAARVHRLAARTRSYLRVRGWRSISIGDADAVRKRSVILYPAAQKHVARKLAAQFGFSTSRNEEVQQVTILLGRDSVRIAGARGGA